MDAKEKALRRRLGRLPGIPTYPLGFGEKMSELARDPDTRHLLSAADLAKYGDPLPVRREPDPEALFEAVEWSLGILRRLVKLGRLDKHDVATVKAVIGALDPRKNPRLRPFETTRRPRGGATKE
jgi:hypothetical protein